MGSNSDGSLSGADKARNGVFDVLDPGHLLTSETKDTSIPKYAQDLNAANAGSAMFTGRLLNTGVTQMGDGAGGSYRYSPLQSGMSPAELLGLNADPNSQYRAQ